MTKLVLSLEKNLLPAKADHILVLIPEQETVSLDHTGLEKETLQRLLKRCVEQEFTGKAGSLLVFDGSAEYETITLGGLGSMESFALQNLREVIAEAVRKHRLQRHEKLTVIIPKVVFATLSSAGASVSHGDVAESVSFGVQAGNYYFTKYKTKEKTGEHIDPVEVTVHVSEETLPKQKKKSFETGLKRGQLLGQGTMLARDFINEPASHFSAEMLAHEAQKIAKASKGKVRVRILEEEDCEKLGMGCYLGVAQGSESKPKFIVLEYNVQKDPKQKTICFIGKSVTFDTGGYSLKPTPFMTDMKMDMSGGAAVLGLFSVLSQWDDKEYGSLPYGVFGILPACENMISGNAFRPGDVLTAMSGKTVEIWNTDAEGRLTLADALGYAVRELQADAIVDLATLTGSAMIALGTKMAALFGNDQKLIDVVKNAADTQGELMWQLPLHEEYAEGLKSEVADIRNIGKERYGDAIMASLFLKEFAEDRPWVHLDIAGPAYGEAPAKGIYTHGGTGYGVRTMLQILLSKTL